MLLSRRFSAALVVALVLVAAVLPLATAGGGRRGCHCVVRMACCEDGTCTMGGDAAPSTGPEWRTCRREAPAATTSIDVFERALTQTSQEATAPSARTLALVVADAVHARVSSPATPPPRSFSF
jgi:hypothetical protein